MRCLVTGAAGFIGSHLVDALIERGHLVVATDIKGAGIDADKKDARWAAERPQCITAFVNIMDFKGLCRAMEGADIVFHLAAHADVRSGPADPYIDLRTNAFGTFQVLDAMRKTGVKRIAFTSTGSVYGETTVHPTPERAPFPVQTSLYGASKLAAEGLIQAWSESYGIEAFIFRLVGILGERYTHGHVIDFVRALQADPDHLNVLGDGFQRKSYLYVKDCVNGMLMGVDKARSRMNIYNLGTREICLVRESVEWITRRMGLNPCVVYGEDRRGWTGDNPFILLDANAIRMLGWQPTKTIREAVEITVDYLIQEAVRETQGA